MGAGSSSLPPEVRAEYHRSIGRSQTCWGRLCRRRKSALRRYLIPLTADEQLRREVIAWRAADDRCRNGCPRTPSDASLADDAPARPALSSASKPRRIFPRNKQVTFRDNHTIIPVPAVRDFGPALFAEVYYTQEDVQAMFLARRSLTASATRALDDGVLDTLDRKATAQLRGLLPVWKSTSLGLEPEERKILGSQLDRAMAVQRSRSVILEYQASPAKQQEPLADYDEVSAHACREGSRAWLLSRDRARAAQVLAAREHEELFGESLRASTARATRRESAERPRRSVIAPAASDAASPPGDLGDMIRNDTFNNLAALCRRGSLPRNSRSPPQ